MRSFLVLSLLSSGLFAAAPPAATRVTFEPNRGQTGPAARFFARVGSGALLFTADGVALRRAGSETDLRLDLVGASPASRWQPGESAPGTTSYILGRDRSQWIRNVPHYQRLLRRAVYPGIDAAWHGDQGRLEYDFIVAPGADPSRIALRARGATDLRLDPDGGLTIETPGGPLRQLAPYVYQTRANGSRAAVPGRFRLLARDTVGFVVGSYDRTRQLTIDPVLESSAYLGGSGEDRIVAVGGPSRYVGTTTSIDFPGAAFKRRGGKDIVVNTGISTWVIGGAGDEEVTAAYIPASGEIAVVGYTNSKDLPTNMSILPRYNTSPKVFQPEYAGGASDGFFLWISDSTNFNSASVYLTYIGTPADDRLTGVSTGFPYGGYAMVGYTGGTGLPSSPNDIQGLQDAPAGGVDGFLVVASNLTFGPRVAVSTYFGGSGDDRPAAIYTSTSGYFIAGETTSPDFPLGPSGTGTLKGPSDAFVLQIAATTSGLAISHGALIGGSGKDRATAITLQGNTILVAGATSSPDLPVVNPFQASYGGGDSDAFLARLAVDFSQTLSLSYAGGSGADEASSLVTDFLGNLFVGGWTASTDFPVSNALQPAFGGGPDDGFLLHFTQDRSLYAATYFGGAGSDRILGVYGAGDHTVWAVGQTTSPDLPTRGAPQTALAGASDGFLARISAPLITAFRAIGAKGMQGFASIYVGVRNGAVDAPVTVTSQDPSSVLLLSGNPPAQASVTLTSAYQPNARIYGIACQVDSGGADLTISADGYPSQTVHADCFPIQARVTNTAATVFYYDQNRNLTTTTWSGAGLIGIALYAVNPALPTDAASLSSLDGGPLAVQPQSSDSSVLKTVAGQTVSSSQFNVSAQGLAIGSASIGFSAPGLTIANTIPIAVLSPLSTADTTIPAGFEVATGVYGGRAPDGAVFTVTSDDPSRLVLSTDNTVPGAASLTSTNGTVYLQALAPGDVTLHASAPGLDPVSSVVHIQPPVVYCAGCARRLDLGVKESQGVSFQVAAAGSRNYPYMTPNPGTTFRFTLDFSTPGIASASPAVFDWKSGVQGYGWAIALAGLAEGDTNLTVHAPDGFTVDPGASFPIHVGRRGLRFPDIDAGKDVATLATFKFPSGMSGPLTLTVADPSRILLSTDNRGAGQKSISYTSVAGATFYVQGLADSGTTTITATSPGLDPVTATVRLGPAGYVWSADSISIVQYSSAPTLYVSPYGLDAATLLPVAPGPLRSGVTAPPQVKSSDTGIVTATDPGSSGAVTLATKGVGTATVSIVQPPGFTAPAVRRDLSVTVRTPTLQLYSGAVGRDLLASASVGVPYGASGQVTLTSGDPSKLLLSSDANTPGAASITVPASQNGRYFVQGLDSSGQVTVTASMPGFNDGKAVFTLGTPGIAMSTSSGGAITTTTQSGKTQVSLSLQVLDPATGKLLASPDGFRPGVTAPSVTVTSSNPAVGTISRSPATVGAGYSGTATVDFVPLTPGDTVLAVVQPDGYIAPATGASISAHVTSPGFNAVDFTMARDTVAGQTAQLGGGVQPPSSNLEVTITSGDPSKLILSDTPEGAAGASVKKVLVAGRYATEQYYVHALDKQGVVPLTISAPGFADTTVKVTLSDLVFQFQQVGGSTPVRALMQSGPQKYTISFHAANASSLGYSPQLPIRPGAAPIVVNVSSSDPATLAVDTPQITLVPGATTATVTVHPVSIGTAVLVLDVPGYTVDKTGGYLAVSVEGARLSLGYGAITLGRDLQTFESVGAEVSLPAGTTVTITSSDPSRLLVSTDPKTPGQGSVTVTTQAYQQPPVWLQALADNGVVTVTASADGFQPATQQVTLLPTAAIFGSTGSQTIFTNSRPQSVSVSLAAFDPVSLRPIGSNGAPRAGANLTTTVSISDKSVLAIDVTTLKFTDSSSQTLQVRPLAPGTAVLSLSALPGGVSPGAAGQLSYSVAEPDVYFQDFVIGRDMQAQAQLTLGRQVPTPTSDLTLKISPDYTASVASGGTVTTYPGSATVVIPAGQRISRPFTVAGVYTGTGMLAVSASGLAVSTSYVTVANSTFVFQDPSPVTISTGASTTLTVVPALLPLGTAAPPGMVIRDGASTIPVVVTPASPSILSVTPPTLVFKPGDSQATVAVKGLAPGSGTLSLSAPAYGTPNAKSTVNVTVR